MVYVFLSPSHAVVKIPLHFLRNGTFDCRGRRAFAGIELGATLHTTLAQSTCGVNVDDEGLRGLLGRDCVIYWGSQINEARTAAVVLLSEEPGPVHSGPSKPFCTVLPLPPIFQTVIIWAVASLLVMSRKGQGMMQYYTSK